MRCQRQLSRCRVDGGYTSGMAGAVAQRLLTAEEFLRYPDDPEGRKLELMDGRVFAVSQPGESHADAALKVLLALHGFAGPHRERLTGTITAVSVPPTNSALP